MIIFSNKCIVRGVGLKILFMLVFFFSFVNFSHACVFTPSVTLKSYCNNIYFDVDTESRPQVDSYLNERKDSCGLSNKDIPIIRDFVNNGYNVLEQTDEEYAKFLNQAKEENDARPDYCKKYSALAHKGRWTGVIYLNSLYYPDRSPKDACPQPNCAGGFASVIWNDIGPTDFQKTSKEFFEKNKQLVFLTALLIGSIALYAAIRLKRKVN